jgi:membrane protease YdiL (CAAX protease family)
MTTILIAVGTGVVVLLAGNLPWAGFGPVTGLMTRNLGTGTAVPWAILPMTLYLWVYWRFISGAWGPSTDRASRRANLRAHRLPSRLWLPSLAAGLVGFATLLALLAVAARVVELPAALPIATPPGMPILTVLLLLAMASVVAGVTEEAAFRGYMQSIVERRYGVVIAILINGILFGLLHFGNHPRDVLLMLPYYVAVSAVYGGLTWAADSILPALVLHTAGDVVVLTRWWATGRPEWQLTAIAPQSVWERGIDAPFVFAAVAAVVLAVATCWAYRRVHDLRVTTRVPAAIAASA